MLIRAASTLVLCGLLAACAQRGATQAIRTPSPATTVNPALRAMQIRLVERDRRARAVRRTAVARVATGRARDVTPPGATVERLAIAVMNRGRRPIVRVDGGVAIYDRRSGERLGLATFSAAARIYPGRSEQILAAIPMGAFAEGAGRLARSAGAAKRVELELTGFGFAAGADAGERD